MNKNIFKLFADLMKLGKLETEQGTLIYDGELTDGTEVFVESETGEMIPAPDGQYGDYTVRDGRIVIEEVVEETPVEVVEETPEVDDDVLINELTKRLDELWGIVEDLKKQLEEQKFSSITPVSQKIKDMSNSKKGALKYFE